MKLKYYILIAIVIGVALGFLFAPDTQVMWYLIISWAGMFTHFLKKIVKDGDEKISKITEYFNNHGLSTLITFTIVSITVVALFFEVREQLNLLSSLGIGYMGDSAANKWEK